MKLKAPEESSDLYLPKKNDNRQFDYLVYIGRFQPFHNGHKHVVDMACNLAKKVIIIIGSCNTPRTIKNPFTHLEREEYIKSILGPLVDKDKVVIKFAEDKASNTEWLIGIQNIIDQCTARTFYPEFKIGIIGFKKDDSSWYLEKLNLEFVNVGSYDHFGEEKVVHSTCIRREFFQGLTLRLSQAKNMPIEMISWMENWKQSRWEDLQNLENEYRFIEEYKRDWIDVPWPVQFITVDAVVIQNGHILLIQRRNPPGRLLWALPGGFVDQHETLREAAIRELKEETRLKVPNKILKSHIRDQTSIPFDNPGRSLRGRTLTHVFLFNLDADPNTGLSEVRGSDDAMDAKWVPLNEFELMAEEMYEDHYFIAEHFIKQL